MNANRLIAIGGLVLSGLLLIAGSNVEYGAEAYRFPNILAYMLACFALVMLFTEGDFINWSLATLRDASSWFFGKANRTQILLPDVVRLVPMFSIIIGYLYFADIIGLYTTSFIAFLAIVTVYGPDRPRSRYFLKYVLISMLFTGAIYLVFAVALQLQSPPALLF